MAIEYKVIEVGHDYYYLAKEINELSKEGWELVNITTTKLHPGNFIFHAALKREIKDDNI